MREGILIDIIKAFMFHYIINSSAAGAAKTHSGFQ